MEVISHHNYFLINLSQNHLLYWIPVKTFMLMSELLWLNAGPKLETLQYWSEIWRPKLSQGCFEPYECQILIVMDCVCLSFNFNLKNYKAIMALRTKESGSLLPDSLVKQFIMCWWVVGQTIDICPLYPPLLLPSFKKRCDNNCVSPVKSCKGKKQISAIHSVWNAVMVPE